MRAVSCSQTFKLNLAFCSEILFLFRYGFCFISAQVTENSYSGFIIYLREALEIFVGLGDIPNCMSQIFIRLLVNELGIEERRTVEWGIL